MNSDRVMHAVVFVVSATPAASTHPTHQAGSVPAAKLIVNIMESQNPIYIECMRSINTAAMAHIRLTYPAEVARQIVSVQPINIDIVAVMNDPLCQMLMGNYAARIQGKPLPHPYSGDE